ncbi:hypothetical protein KM043_016200 [Ampulex compressa]|nr:hypothetical protein KM043_016200 [Ampulex compressa]
MLKMTHLKIPAKRVIEMMTILLYIQHAYAKGISCFKCVVAQSEYEPSQPLCSQFDASSKFQVYCPASTLCMKKTIYYKSKTAVTKTVLRDCASQKHTFQSYNNTVRKWYETEEVVTTAYEESCFVGEDRGAPGGPPEYCFCSYHLCNSSPSNNIMDIFYFYLVAMTILSIKLL